MTAGVFVFAVGVFVKSMNTRSVFMASSTTGRASFMVDCKFTVLGTGMASAGVPASAGSTNAPAKCGPVDPSAGGAVLLRMPRLDGCLVVVEAVGIVPGFVLAICARITGATCRSASVVPTGWTDRSDL